MQVRHMDLPAALDDIRRWRGVERPTPYKSPNTPLEAPAEAEMPAAREARVHVPDRGPQPTAQRAAGLPDWRERPGRDHLSFLLPDGTLALAAARRLRAQAGADGGRLRAPVVRLAGDAGERAGCG